MHRQLTPRAKVNLHSLAFLLISRLPWKSSQRTRQRERETPWAEDEEKRWKKRERERYRWWRTQIPREKFHLWLRRSLEELNGFMSDACASATRSETQPPTNQRWTKRAEKDGKEGKERWNVVLLLNNLIVSNIGESTRDEFSVSSYASNSFLILCPID